MAQYKVIQDIEAEDKLLGPLSFRQFLYFLIAAFLGFLNFMALTRGAWPVILLLGPPMLFCLFFAWPWSPDQPTEVWALARIRYFLKPRKRLWNQSGVKEFVTITVPKKIEKFYTDGLSQDQVRSRLEALSQTIDSRGWAIKNSYRGRVALGNQSGDERLLAYENIPQEVAYADVHDSDDILDARNNPAAYQMGQMIDASSRAHRQAIMEKMQATTAPATAPSNPQWFQRKQAGDQPIISTPLPGPATALPSVPMPESSPPAAAPRLVSQPAAAMQTPPQPVEQTAPAAPIQATPNPVILNLAHDNNMDVATLAREAKRAQDVLEDEVVVSLH